MSEIVNVSPALLQKLKEIKAGAHGNTKYPWRTLEPGQSFIIPLDRTKEHTLASYCSRMSKKLNKQFVYFRHEASEGFAGGYEVSVVE